MDYRWFAVPSTSLTCKPARLDTRSEGKRGTMSLLTEATAVGPAQRGPICGYRVTKEARPELAAELDELMAAIASRLVYASTASRILKDHEIALSPDSLLRHAKRECACP